MKLVTLDFETYYSSDYSLRKLTHEEYVRDSRFQSLMMAYAVNDGAEQIAIGRAEIEKALQSLALHESGTVTIAHNAGFEGAILEWRYGVRINTLICTMAMARGMGLDRLSKLSLEALAEFFHEVGLNEEFKGDEVGNMKDKRLEDFSQEELLKAVNYCKNDVHITRKIFKLMLPYLYDGALEIIDMTMKMFTRPMFKLDVPKLVEYKERIIRTKEEELDRLANKLGMDRGKLQSTIKSNKEFPHLFKRATGIDIPLKLSEAKTKTFNKKLTEAKKHSQEAVDILISKTDYLEVVDGKYLVYSPATAKDDLAFQELAESSNPLVTALVNAKISNSSNIHESRAERLIGVGERGLLPITLIFASAHTGRYGGGGKLNPQNFPSRGDRTIRDSLCAPEGYKIIAGDSSQIEARLLAYIANQQDVLEIFSTGGDVYSHMASRIYNVPYEWIVEMRSKSTDGLNEEQIADVKKAKAMRSIGKEAVLASGYQMSGRAFAVRLKAQGTMITPLDGTEGMSEEEIEAYHEAEANRINGVYRNSNTMITGLWQRCQRILDELIAGGDGFFGGPDDSLFYYGYRELYGKRVPGIKLPNGFWILYPNLKKEINPETGFAEFTYRAVDKGFWRAFYIYGGKIVENITQAIAFAVLQDQAIEIRKYGVPIIINIHDEWATCVKEEYALHVKSIFEWCMSIVPSYIEGCPLSCEVDMGDNYGEV